MNPVGNIAKMVLCYVMLGGLADRAGGQEVLDQWALSILGQSSIPGTTAGFIDNTLDLPPAITIARCGDSVTSVLAGATDAP